MPLSYAPKNVIFFEGKFTYSFLCFSHYLALHMYKGSIEIGFVFCDPKLFSFLFEIK